MAAIKVADQANRLRSIDALRGLAALAVVVDHAMLYGNWPDPSPSWFLWIHSVGTLGLWGVPLFFVISGFCIHLRWAKRYASTGEERLDFIDFWKRRLHRLYPPYFFALCVSMTLVLAGYLMHKAPPLIARYPEPKLRNMALDFFLHITMLHGFSIRYDTMGGNPAFWTLAREEYFYLLYFVLLPLRRKIGLVATVVSVGVLGLAFIPVVHVWAPGDPEFLLRSPIVLWIQWCLGMVAVESYYGLIKLPPVLSSPWMAAIWGVLANFCFAYYQLLFPLCWGMCFFTLLNAFVQREKAGTWPSNRLVDRLSGVGIFSYSLYLVHQPARHVLKYGFRWMAQTQTAPYYLLVVAVLAVGGYWAGRIYFELVEKHFLNSSRASRAVSLPLEAAASAD